VFYSKIVPERKKERESERDIFDFKYAVTLKTELVKVIENVTIR